MEFSIILKTILILRMVLLSFTQYAPSPYYPPMAGAMSPMGSPMAPMGGAMMPSMQQAFPRQRLPVMVMPYHSKSADRKYMKKRRRRPKKHYRESVSSSDSCSSSDEYSRSRRDGSRKKKRQVLTPVISYVTRNGRVVYQKKIKKENAGDWLEMGAKRIPSKLVDADEESSGETLPEIKRKYGRSHHHHHEEDY